MKAIIATLLVGVTCLPAWAAVYSTVPSPPAAASAAMLLTVTDDPPLCEGQARGCIATQGRSRSYSVMPGDQISIGWTDDPESLYGVVQLGYLYLPIASGSTAITPVTLQVVSVPSGLQILVMYGETRQHVPVTPGYWQPLRIYTPEERTLYLRLDEASAPAN